MLFLFLGCIIIHILLMLQITYIPTHYIITLFIISILYPLIRFAL